MFLQVECVQIVENSSNLIYFDKFLLKNTIYVNTNNLFLNCISFLLSRQQLLYLLNELVLHSASINPQLHQECISIVKSSIKQVEVFSKMFQRNLEILPLESVQILAPIDNTVESITEQLETSIVLKKQDTAEQLKQDLNFLETILKSLRHSKDSTLKMWNNHKKKANFMAQYFQFCLFNKKVTDMTIDFSKVAKITNEKTKINIQLQVIVPLESILQIPLQQAPPSISTFWNVIFGTNTTMSKNNEEEKETRESFFGNTFYSKLKKKRTYYDYLRESGKYKEETRFRTELKVAEEFLVPNEKLELIGMSNALRYQLGEESLQKILLDIDTDTHKEMKLQHFLQNNSQFKTFADQVLFLFGEKELDEIIPPSQQ